MFNFTIDKRVKLIFLRIIIRDPCDTNDFNIWKKKITEVQN